MTPFEILRRTPKNNCGKCGHPTCLAFAAAVATSNESPTNCPFIDLTGLSLPDKAAAGGRSPAESKDLALIQHLKSKITGLDFTAIAAALGVEAPDADTLRFRFLGQGVLLDRSGIWLDGREPEDPRDQILIYNYIHSRGGQEPCGEKVGLESLPNSISKVRTLAVYCEDRLAELFARHSRQRVMATALTLGAEAANESSASIAITVPVLPRVPIVVLYWEAEPEDGFAAKVKVLFDSRVMDFLDLESLVFAAERLADRYKALLES